MRACPAMLLVFAMGSTALAQIDPRAALLEKAGWDAIVGGQAAGAADRFRQAIAIDPKNPRLYLGAGTAAWLDRRDGDAKESLERALTIDPTLGRARVLLGLVLHRMGEVPGAIRIYERLAADAPDDKEAAATLERWRRELALHDRMQQSVGAHFLVSFEGGSEAVLAAEALASLDRAYWRIGGVLGLYLAEPVPVVLYTNEQFRDVTRSPRWAAGAFDGTIRVPMLGALHDQKELDRVLAHEFTHALVRRLSARQVPAWLDEGLAAALENGDLGWAEERVRKAGAASLAELERGFGRFEGAEADLAYATSALAARRLVEEAGGFAIANLLRDLGDGVDFDAAFFRRIQRTFRDFQRGF